MGVDGESVRKRTLPCRVSHYVAKIGGGGFRCLCASLRLAARKHPTGFPFDGGEKPEASLCWHFVVAVFQHAAEISSMAEMRGERLILSCRRETRAQLREQRG